MEPKPMATLHPKFIVDEHDGKQAVVLSLDDWNAILEDLDELDAIRAYDKAKAKPHDAIPLDQAIKEIEESA
jgi:PHD/YefM family antitoxin component YafN of YafNO toxin-antitoxin module